MSAIKLDAKLAPRVQDVGSEPPRCVSCTLSPGRWVLTVTSSALVLPVCQVDLCTPCAGKVRG